LLTWDLNADLGFGTRAVPDREVPITINETTAPHREAPRLFFSIKHALKERRGTIGDPALPDAVKIDLNTELPMQRSAEQVGVLFMTPATKF
jgi:hypothetical protein